MTLEDRQDKRRHLFKVEDTFVTWLRPRSICPYTIFARRQEIIKFAFFNNTSEPGQPADNDVRHDRQRQRRQACPTKRKRQKKGDRPTAAYKN